MYDIRADFATSFSKVIQTKANLCINMKEKTYLTGCVLDTK